jgi:hypothetical protein
MMNPRLLFGLAVALTACAPQRSAPAPALGFAKLVDTLSEPGGYFDSDNLISNETAHLHVIGALRRLGVHGGTYIGVGPEQNFSYIAEIEPELALLIDIRRDNLLLHLLFKAMFEASETRIEYLSQLFGRSPPPDPRSWAAKDLPLLLNYLDQAASDSAAYDSVHRALMSRIEGYNIPLSAEDRSTMRRFHDEFARNGLGLTFTTLGRPPQRNYPTVRRLYLETDLEGNRVSYLASEERWRRVRDRQRQNRVVPVVGDMGGTHAIRSIAEYLRNTDRTVSAFYASNVEFYLMRAGTFRTWVESVRLLPATSSSVLIRSYFDRGFGGPDMQPGHFSSQHLQTFDRFLAMVDEPVARTYLDLVSDTASARLVAPAAP